MAAAVTAAIVSFPSSKSTSLSSRTSIVAPERVIFKKVPLQLRDGSTSWRVVSIRAQVTTEAPTRVEKESNKQEEGVIVNKFKPKNPYIGRCLLNTKITVDDALGETWHMVFSTEGEGSCVFSFPLFSPSPSITQNAVQSNCKIGLSS